MSRVITEGQVIKAIEEAETEARSRSLNGDKRLKLVRDRLSALFAEDVTATVSKTIALVGLAEAATVIFGDVKRKSHVTRLRNKGELPNPVAELASGPVYLRADIEAVAERLRTERDERAERSAERAERRAARAARKAEKDASVV